MARAGELKPRGRIRTWVRRVILGLLALVVLAVGAVLILIHTDWGRDKIREQVESGLRGAFPGGVKVGKLEGSVFTELVVRDVELDGLDHQPMITVGEIRVSVALKPLMKRTIEVEHLAISDVTVSIHPQPPGPPPPPPDPLAPPPSPSSWSFSVGEVEVHRAAFALTTATAERYTIDGIEIAGAAAKPARGSLTARGSVTGTWRERGAPITAAVTISLGDAIHVPLATILAGGTSVSAYDLLVDGAQSHGTIAVSAPAAAVAQLAPGVELPGDAALAIDAGALGNGTQLELFGALGTAHLRGSLRLDMAREHLSGVVSAAGLDLGELSQQRRTGTADVTAIVAGSPRSQRLLVATHSEIDGLPAGDTTISVELKTLNGARTAHAIVAAIGPGGAKVAATATVHQKPGEPIEIERAHATAVAADLTAATNGLVTVKGDLRASIAASGPLVPTLPSKDPKGRTIAGRSIEFTGVASGASLVAGNLRIGAARADFDGEVTQAGPRARATATADRVTNAGSPLGRATADVVLHRDRSLSVSATAYPPVSGLVASVDATVVFGALIDVLIAKHSVRLPSGAVWSGTGGRVAISPATIAVKGVKSASGAATVALGAELARGSGALSATLDAVAIPASMFDPTYRGTAAAQLSVQQRRGAWTGGGTVTATSIALGPDAAPFDASAKLGIAGRRVDVDAQVVHTKIGTVEVQVGVDGPADPTDAAGWKRVERKDVRVATVTLKKIQAGELGAAGTIDGDLHLGAGDTRGTVTVRDVATKAGSVDADVTVTPGDSDDRVVASATAKLAGIGDAGAVARFQLPLHVFDPAAWRALGHDALVAASAEIDDVAIDAQLLQRFGAASPYRGKAAVAIAVGPGARSARVDLDVTDVRGGALAKPLVVHADVIADGTDTKANVTAAATGGPALVDLAASLPVSLDRWTTAPDAALRAPLSGTLVFGSRDAPSIAMHDLLAVVGRDDITRGALTGSATLHGTPLAPLGELSLFAKDVQVAPRFTGRETPAIALLQIDSKWLGTAGSLDVLVVESSTGTLKLHVDGSPAALALAKGRVDVEKLDLAPVAAMLPGALVATTGILDSHLTFAGLDKLAGTVDVSKGRIALSPTIGTLRSATVDAKIEHGALTADISGLLGQGKVDIHATGSPTKVDATATLSKLQPIGALQPIIDAKVVANLALTGEQWRGTVEVTNGVVTIPSQSGNELLAASPPSDLIFLDQTSTTILHSRVPLRPWLVAQIGIRPTRIDGDNLAGAVGLHGVVYGDLTLSMGDVLGLDGTIWVERADVDVFGRRYEVEASGPIVSFDGTTDPLLDLRLVHEFPDLTLEAHIGGRGSKVEPTFSSQPGTYTEAQLLGFFLGGTPGGDSSSQTREAAAGAGASVLSYKVGMLANKLLPVGLRVDTLACEPATSSTSTSCTLGRWLNHSLYLAATTRIDARPDENVNEGSLQYYFLPKWSLDLSGGDRNYDGLDVLWRTRW